MSPPTWRGRPSDNSETAPNHQFAPVQRATGSLSLQADEPETPALDHALPAKHFDRLRLGVPRDRVEPRLVRNVFVSIAMSAQRRGWTQNEFIGLATTRTWWKHNAITMTGSYGLWAQLGSMSRRPMRDLDKAWEQAASNLRGEGMWTYEDVRANAVEAAWAWADRLAAAVDDLEVTEAMVMHYVVDQVEKRGMSEVTCPCREVAAHVGCNKNTAFRKLRDLTERGLLIQESPGHASKKKFVTDKITGKTKTEIVGGQAAIYRLADPFVTSPSNDGT